MTTETLPVNTVENENTEPVATNAELEAIVNPTPESTDDREMSPNASRLSRLSGAISSFADKLESRAVNRAHSQASAEDASRSRDILNAQSVAPELSVEDAFANFDARKEQSDKDYVDQTETINTNLAQKAEQKQNRIEARETAILEAKDAVKRTGRIAVQHAVTAGTFAVGVGALAAEATVSGTIVATEKGKDLAETGALKALYGVDAVQGKLETATLKTMYVTEQGKEAVMNTVESVRSKLDARAEAAKQLREARRTRWAEKKASFTNRGREAIDSTKEKARNGLGRAHAARAAGSAALSAIASAKADARSAYSTHIDQNRS